ncbi:hypothetical protein ACMD2_00693 [Ananas comosus]|uniref:Uncharacterized protein n=1 Tax=Ananas comosus TaxID=4615 RepID=A0A199VDK4_ANACO|nr:hypothetical protein ACMD2_00693 [Ananas comosus]
MGIRLPDVGSAIKMPSARRNVRVKYEPLADLIVRSGLDCPHRTSKLMIRSHGNKLQRGGGLSRSLREHRSSLYIIRRCAVMLLCYHD